MSELSVTAYPSAERNDFLPLQVRLAWRNLWRNRKRTWLTASGIAFAILLVNSLMAIQHGVYIQMKGLGTSLYNGHAEISSEAFVADNGLIDTIPDAAARVAALKNLESTEHVLPRAEAFALASVDERSFGAQVLGVDIAQEQQALTYLNKLTAGRLPSGPDEAVVGSLLAKNLRAAPGSEIVILGSGKYGGVAAAALTIVGIVSTGIADMDRVLVVTSLQSVQETFELIDEVHRIVLIGDGPDAAAGLATQAAAAMTNATTTQTPTSKLLARAWPEVLPDLKQTIDIDQVSGKLMYWILLGMVSFTVVNSFVMTIFERTREFGMLRAIGMRPGQMIWLLQWEALFIWAVGAIIGVIVSSALIFALSQNGIPMGEMGEAMSAQLFIPTHIYPAFTLQSLLHAPAILLVGCLLAALIPALRLFKLKPVEALREH